MTQARTIVVSALAGGLLSGLSGSDLSFGFTASVVVWGALRIACMIWPFAVGLIYTVGIKIWPPESPG